MLESQLPFDFDNLKDKMEPFIVSVEETTVAYDLEEGPASKSASRMQICCCSAVRFRFMLTTRLLRIDATLT